MIRNNLVDVFLTLLKAGLWENDVQLLQFGIIDFGEVLRLAEEQSVVGLIAAGLEHIVDCKPEKTDSLQFVGQTMQMEQRNTAMNIFVAELIEKMREDGILALVVKGQGIAQCYERPLWRACGDVDLLLDDRNYQSAKVYLTHLAESVDQESGKHLGMRIGNWVVELHGNLHCGLSSRMDFVIDEVQRAVFDGAEVRPWSNGKTQVLLPAEGNDVIFIFTHFIKHFYKGGLGLRQVCDWARLLWSFKDTLDYSLLESRIRRAGLMSEWKAFAAFAVVFLGMPADAMPLYSSKTIWKRKADRIWKFILVSGNFGHNRDSKYRQYPFYLKKFYAMSRRLGDLVNHSLIFPMDSIRFLPIIIMNGVKAAIKGIG